METQNLLHHIFTIFPNISSIFDIKKGLVFMYVPDNSGGAKMTSLGTTKKFSPSTLSSPFQKKQVAD
jgi:hypothetical protein